MVIVCIRRAHMMINANEKHLIENTDSWNKEIVKRNINAHMNKNN